MEEAEDEQPDHARNMGRRGRTPGRLGPLSDEQQAGPEQSREEAAHLVVDQDEVERPRREVGARGPAIGIGVQIGRIRHGEADHVDREDAHHRDAAEHVEGEDALPWLGRSAHLSALRMTSFSPDQVSSTAQTLMSTSPIGSATSRTTSSVTSVGSFEAFFDQDTQICPSRASRGRRRSSESLSSVRPVMKMWAASMANSTGTSARRAPSISVRTEPGMASNRTRMPSFSDSFFASG